MKMDKETKKEMKEMVELTTKIMKKMDGYSIFICARVLTGILANLLVANSGEDNRDDLEKELFDMLSDAVKARKTLEALLYDDNGVMH